MKTLILLIGCVAFGAIAQNNVEQAAFVEVNKEVQRIKAAETQARLQESVARQAKMRAELERLKSAGLLPAPTVVAPTQRQPATPAYYNREFHAPGLGAHLQAIEKRFPGMITNYQTSQIILTNKP